MTQPCDSVPLGVARAIGLVCSALIFAAKCVNSKGQGVYDEDEVHRADRYAKFITDGPAAKPKEVK